MIQENTQDKKVKLGIKLFKLVQQDDKISLKNELMSFAKGIIADPMKNFESL